MLWIILGLIIGFVIGLEYAIKECWSFWEGVGTTALIVLCGFLVSLLCCTVSSVIADSCAEKTYYVAEDVDIYALRDNVTTEGQFFLGSGHVDNELKYFYVREAEFGYTVSNVDADQTYIKYTTDRCHLEKLEYTFSSEFVNAIAVPFSERYVFYIPEGSITNNYSVDLG